MLGTKVDHKSLKVCVNVVLYDKETENLVNDVIYAFILH